MINGNNGGFNDQQYGGQDYNFPPQMAFDGSPGRGMALQLMIRHQIIILILPNVFIPVSL
jgi:hypothetical protein